MSKPYAVVFAGVPGSSKSIVAHELSCQFGLPIYSTDNVRFEVREDLRADTINRPDALREFNKRNSDRWKGFLALQRPIIRDGSVDRTWPDVKSELLAAGYDWFMIDMELSQEFIEKLYKDTGRPVAVQQLPMYLAQHNSFMADYEQDVDVFITDDNFHNRRAVAVAGLQRYLDTAGAVAI
ncbi:MAG TPA: hypothetical protein VFI84_00720 [Candidatus Saccharimonadales bacterium]|nr:hypothetical protein [Candidatus Saccharimonadales bacterium]